MREQTKASHIFLHFSVWYIIETPNKLQFRYRLHYISFEHGGQSLEMLLTKVRMNCFFEYDLHTQQMLLSTAHIQGRLNCWRPYHRKVTELIIDYVESSKMESVVCCN